MRIRFSEGKQNWLMEKAISKAGSERKLSKIIKISHQQINKYRLEKLLLPDTTLNILLNFLNLNRQKIENFVISELDDNWGRFKGGVNLIKKHKLNGTYKSYLIHLKKRGKRVFSNWHKTMKKNNPELYYKMQHEKFKRIGIDKYRTKKGHLVRNKLELDIANFLYSKGFEYEYEPYLKINNSVYFPDFKIGNFIIECTAWRGYLKISSIRKKIRDYEKAGFSVRYVIPPEIKKFYKAFKSRIIEDNDKATLAQTTRKLSV